MSVRTLEDKFLSVGNPVDMLRNAPSGPYQFPVKAEFTSWRDEQEAWRHGAVLFGQSFHMTDHYIEGPDVKRRMEDLAVNSMAGFRRDVAKQVVFCNHDGYLVGDGFMFILADEREGEHRQPAHQSKLGTVPQGSAAPALGVLPRCRRRRRARRRRTASRT